MLFLFLSISLRQKKIHEIFFAVNFFWFVYNNNENESKNPVRPIKSQACDCVQPTKSQTRDHNIFICVVLAYAFKVKGYVISDQSFSSPRFVIFKAEKQTFIKASKE